MEPNSQNQNLPPVPDPPEDYKKKTLAPPVPQPPMASSAQEPPLPPIPPPAGNVEQVNFIDSESAKQSNKKIIIFSIVAVLAILAIYGIYAAVALRKDIKNVEVSGDQMSFTWQGKDILAQMGPKETLSFFTNGGGLYSRNSANFMVIPLDKIRYLEQKYSDFTHCGSPGEAEAKSSSFPIEIITNNTNAEINLSRLENLVKKQNLVVFEIDGSPLQQMQINQAGKNIPMRGNMEFYLVDDVRIVQENYK